MQPEPVALEIAALEDLPHVDAPRWGHWLTGPELTYCRGFRRAHEHLGARFAAKRAVTRALGWPDTPPWHEIEVLREPSSAPVVRLAGRADEWRRAMNLGAPGVSLTHAGGFAAAVSWLRETS